MPTFEITSPDGIKYHVEGPEGATQEQALAQVQAQHGAQTPPSVGQDIARSLPGSVEQAITGTAGIPGDVRELMAKGVSMGASLLGQNVSQQGASNVLRHVPMLGSPTSEQLQSGLDTALGGPGYEPQTPLGKASRTAIGLLPAIVGGPEGLATKLLTRVAAPTLATTAAEQMGGGPGAQTAAAIAASVAAHRAVTPRPSSITPSSTELKSMGPVEALKNPTVDSVILKSPDVEKVADTIAVQLRRDKFNPTDSSRTFNLLEDMKEPINGQAHKIEDLQRVRERLGDIAGDFNAGQDRAAATRAIKELDNYANNIPASHVLSGDMRAAQQIMAESRANFAHGASAARVEEKIRNADLAGGTTAATQSKMRQLLTSPKGRMGMSEKDLAGIESAATGAGKASKALGAAGTALNTVPSLVGAWHFGGPAGMAAMRGTGETLKALSARAARSQAQAVVQQILERSPEAQRRVAIAARHPIPAPLPAAAVGLLSGSLANPQRGGLLGGL